MSETHLFKNQLEHALDMLESHSYSQVVEKKGIKRKDGGVFLHFRELEGARYRVGKCSHTV